MATRMGTGPRKEGSPLMVTSGPYPPRDGQRALRGLALALTEPALLYPFRRLSTSLEMLDTATLIHDDLIDGAAPRPGDPPHDLVGRGHGSRRRLPASRGYGIDSDVGRSPGRPALRRHPEGCARQRDPTSGGRASIEQSRLYRTCACTAQGVLPHHRGEEGDVLCRRRRPDGGRTGRGGRRGRWDSRSGSWTTS